MAKTSNSATARRASDRLMALRGDPAARAAFALEVLESEETNFDVVFRCAEVLAADPLVGARPALLRRYRELADTPRRDPGAFTRAAIVRALRDISTAEDADIFDRAATTFEPSMQEAGGPTLLRAAGMAALQRLDPKRAAIRAAQSLADAGRTSVNSGEPALTAAKVLAANGEDLALLLFVLSTKHGHEEVVAECLRWLRDLPAYALQPVVERYSGNRREAMDLGEMLEAAAGRHSASQREIVLLGYSDLLIDHEPDAFLASALRQLLGSSTVDVYRYAVTAIIASHRADLMGLLLEHAATVTEKEKVAVLGESLPLARGVAGVDELLARLGALTPTALPISHATRDEDARLPAWREMADDGDD